MMNQAEVKRRQVQLLAVLLGLLALTVASRLTGYHGVTYVLAALEIYAVFDAVISGGVYEALGRLLRLRNTKGQYRNTAAMKKNAAVFQAALGLCGAVLLLTAAEKMMTAAFRIQYSSAILMLLAPALLLRAVSAVLQGYSRGEGSELPAAAAGILRLIFVIGFSMIFSKILGNYGSKVSMLLAQENFTAMYGGVGIAIAVTLAEFFVVLFLLLADKGTKRKNPPLAAEGMRTTDSFADSVRILCAGRGTGMALRLLLLLVLPLGLLFFGKSAGWSDAAMMEYGVFAAGYGLCCGVPVVLVVILLLSVCGKISVLLRREENRLAKQVFQSGVHLGIVHAAFWTVLIAVLAEPLAEVLCPNADETAAALLAGGSGLILFLVPGLFFARILLLLGKKLIVLVTAAVADVSYILSVTLLLNAGKAGILSLVYGGILAAGVLCFVLGIFSYRQLRLKPDWLHMLIFPAAAACVAGLVGMLLEKLFTPHLGSFVSALVCLILTGALYWAGLILLRNFREAELDNLPGGRLIGALGQLLNRYF